MSVPTNDNLLTTLLSSTSYKLAYSLPLLFLSLILTFSGAFFTLDRSRTFPPRNDATVHTPPKSRRSRLSIHWPLLLRGGIGGLASGYTFGVYFATFLALLIPNVSTSNPLTAQSFSAVWILSGIICTVLAGRWKAVALAFSGISGFSTLALALSVILHPSLLSRIILASIFLPIGTALCLLPIRRTQHTFVRIAAAAIGAFGVIVTIALLSNISAWGNVWERLWVSNGDNWGTSKEKGLSAAYCFLLSSGIACDWFLKRRFGENPDEKWDSYLAEYTSNLPNMPDRAGTFRPLASFWERYFGHHRQDPVVEDMLFPSDADLKQSAGSPFKPHRKSSGVLRSTSPEPLPSYRKGPGFLKKDRKRSSQARIPGMRHTREAVKFQPLVSSVLSSSDEDEDEEDAPKSIFERTVSGRRPNANRMDSLATLTNDAYPVPQDDIDVAKEGAKLRLAKSDAARQREAPEYSDFEEDVAETARCHTSRDAPGWSPAFIRRHSTRESRHHDVPVPSRHSNGNQSSRTLVPSPSPVPFAPVPATPSLIRAIDRIAVAQQVAYGPRSPPLTPPANPVREGLPSTSAGPMHEFHGAKWDSFWRDVKAKAGHEHH